MVKEESNPYGRMFKMTSRDRVIKTYNFQIPDRIPLDFCADDPVYDALIERTYMH